MCLGLKLMPTVVKINFLVAESECSSTIAESFELHLQNTSIEVLCGSDINASQDDMINMVN